MTESDLRENVRAACKVMGLEYYFTYDSRRSPLGFPDFTIWGASVIFRELKTSKGRLTDRQKAVGQSLLAAGADWAVWRPEDWANGVIQSQLQALRPRTRAGERASGSPLSR